MYTFALTVAQHIRSIAMSRRTNLAQQSDDRQLEDFNAIADTFVPDQLSIDELRHEVTRIKTERKRGKEKP